jgi:putative ABC transport system permease protein
VIVGQRAHEFGLRMTLGARPGQVVRMVLRGGMTWVAAGLILGIVAGAAMTRWAQSLLYSPDRIDVAAIGGAAAVLVAAALLACLVPARRAARVDPAVAMRQ